MRVQLPLGLACELEFVPERGPVTSVSVELFSSGDTELVAGPVAEVDAFDEALTVAVGLGETTATVADTTGLVLGDPYWLGTSGGRGIIVRPVDATATVVHLDERAPFAIATGSLKGHRCSVILTDDDTATKRRRCEARWTYVVAGRTYRASELFDIVRRPFRLVVTEEDIATTWTAFGEYRGQSDSWKKYVAWASEQIELWIAAFGREPDLCREPRHLVRAAAAYVCARLIIKDKELHDTFNEEAGRILGLLEASNMWIDDDDDGVVDDDPAGSGDGGELGHGLIRYATVT